MNYTEAAKLIELNYPQTEREQAREESRLAYVVEGTEEFAEIYVDRLKSRWWPFPHQPRHAPETALCRVLAAKE